MIPSPPVLTLMARGPGFRMLPYLVNGWFTTSKISRQGFWRSPASEAERAGRNCKACPVCFHLAQVRARAGRLRPRPFPPETAYWPGRVGPPPASRWLHREPRRALAPPT
jgi:hypothetical protein